MDDNVKHYKNLIRHNDEEMHRCIGSSSITIMAGFICVAASSGFAHYDFNMASIFFGLASCPPTALAALSARNAVVYAKALVTRENQLNRYLQEHGQKQNTSQRIPSKP